VAARALRRDQGGRGEHDEHGPPAGHRAVLRQPDPLHPLQLHHGDAAGQNLTGKATQEACRWIQSQYPGIEHHFLESNFATDKKASQINVLRTRGKRIVAEATIPDALLRKVMRTSSEQMFRARQVSNLGAFMSGANNNGAHSANGITALFIATGQDAANVAESSAALVHVELRPNGTTTTP
jgi:hydroxymethylglutaryl-CoA reductase (NADPH)